MTPSPHGALMSSSPSPGYSAICSMRRVPLHCSVTVSSTWLVCGVSAPTKQEKERKEGREGSGLRELVRVFEATPLGLAQHAFIRKPSSQTLVRRTLKRHTGDKGSHVYYCTHQNNSECFGKAPSTKQKRKQIRRQHFEITEHESRKIFRCRCSRAKTKSNEDAESILKIEPASRTSPTPRPTVATL